MEIVKGLNIDVPSAELADHMNRRIVYHGEKSRFYGDKAKELEKGGMDPAQGYSNNPVGSLNQSARSHREKAAFFAFMKEHLIKDVVYRLDEGDLGRLEIASRYWGVE